MLSSLFKKRFSLLSTLALAASSLAGCEGAPPEAAFTKESQLGTTGQALSYNGSDYLFITTPKTWNEARSACRKLGYDLVTLNDSAEEALLETQENARNMRNVWIGINDQSAEGVWSWTSGTSQHTNWNPGEPNNLGDEDCTVDRFSDPAQNIFSEKWNDARCDSAYAFICERPAVSNATNRGSFYFSASYTSNATVNTTSYSVNLEAGRIFTAGTCGVPGAWGSNDTHLRLFNAAGQEIAASDDAKGPCGILSNFSIVVPESGTYVIRAGCFGGDSCEGTVAFNY
jgi:hypothetical protein